MQVVKFLLVAAGLRLRTVVARLGLPMPTIHIDISAANEAVKNFDFEYLNEVRCFSDKFELFGQYYSVEQFLQFSGLELNKSDYLACYTANYCHWLNSFLTINENNTELSQKVVLNFCNSKVRWQAFVISQQIFAFCTAQAKLTNLLDRNWFEKELISMIGFLGKNIEHHVDGNHVLENLIALIVGCRALGIDSKHNEDVLISELNRQSVNGLHFEKNIKYTFDIVSKLIVLAENSISTERINPFIESYSAIFKYAGRYPIHDNIAGDVIFDQIDSLRLQSSSINPVGRVTDWLPSRGVRGHSFDCRFSLGPILSNFFECKPFGTATYADSRLRKYQRMRFNNSCIYLHKGDASSFFWKSFRFLGILPSFIIAKGGKFIINELVVSNFRVNFLRYQVWVDGDSVCISSKRSISITMRFDNLHDIPKVVSGKKTVSPSCRYVGIGKRQRCTKIELTGDLIKLQYNSR